VRMTRPYYWLRYLWTERRIRRLEKALPKARFAALRFFEIATGRRP